MATEGSSNWDEYTQTWNLVQGNALVDSGEVWPVLSVAFVPDSELIYTGDASGRLTTYTLNDISEPLDRQTSFVCAHTPLSQLLPLGSNKVLVQSSDMFQLRTAGGRQIFGKTTTPNDPFTAAALNYSTCTDAIVCTSAGTGSLIDLNRGTVVKRINLESSSVVLDLERNALTSGTTGGYLAVRDPRTNFGLVYSAPAFSGPVTDLVTAGTYIYACGTKAGPENGYQMAPDSMVKIFDKRNMTKHLDGINCEDGTPTRLCVNGNNLWICHDSGYAETRLLDSSESYALGDVFIEPALSEYAYASAFCVSPSGNAALVADTDGVLHLWSDQEYPQLSMRGKFPDLLPSQHEQSRYVRGSELSIDDERISLAVVAMPQIKEPLLSRMDNNVLYDVGRPVNFVDPEIIGHLKKIDSVEYAPNPRNYKRNQQAFGPWWRSKWKDGVDAFKDDAELTQGRSKFLSVQRHRGEQLPPAIAGSSILNEGRVSSIDTNVSRGSPSTQNQQLHQQQQGGSTRFPVDMSSGGKIPKQMQRMRIEYSRFGVEDFDFSLYNSTRWSGLEGNIANSYANSLLQMLFFTSEFRTLVMSHCATDCSATKCLSCQMGLLFRMLQTANGTSCQAVQLLNILADRSEATALALLEDAHGNLADGAMYSIIAQRLLRFFLEQANSECASLSNSRKEQHFVEQAVGFPQETKTVCPVCSHTQVRTSHAFSVDLDSPQGSNGLATLLAGGSASVRRADKMRSGKKTDILELLQQSLARCDTTRAWCAKCKKFQFLSTHRRITQAPGGYMAINFPKLDLKAPSSLPPQPAPSLPTKGTTSSGATAALLAGGDPGLSSANVGEQQGAATSWQTTLPLGFTLHLDRQNKDQQVHVSALDKSFKPEEVTHNNGSTTYQLSAVVSAIRDTPRGPEHLVVHVRNPDKHDGGSWLLFNDFLVQPVSEESVVGLSDWWRAPTIALYASADRQCLADTLADIVKQYPYKISTRILTHPTSVLDRPVGNRRTNSSQPGTYIPNRNQAVPLTRQEAESVESGGFMCAFDAEFVVLEAAKTEVFSDGTQQVLQPEIHTLARLSVVRASGGPLHSVPFIDDYVETSRPIADLATQYSGIHAGDLTVGTSPYKLSTMKEAYKKLRLLVDSGCIIIGHGLKHDFRVCNIVVPAAQQRDTMVLFQSPQHIRPIALRFLYWFFYQKYVQTGEHSSVEDAQTALKVFESYRRCVGGDGEYDIGGIEDILDQIYESGSKLAWKTPDA
ncbi:poly(A)-specific ribonuclease [Coemansia sp. RSA 1813]|nr:poly(A)-specific ribonuclease [Coemansia sp. RSA 1646]KAJ1766812.1 poly(A)-specific ribonuclease [Coemansia sp. RSA 1843]KAJ2088021.1 poly(A)-specific ribonuclease [Coemansia sp. RSA 986]KAJ2211960.1 poly(A)-specific ribonuclease [Coemansia sp. RSA 487]KAJ2565859.1 poly(A)-specific ribonuclease [Coemansia sp. RSA 1813]